MRIALVGSLYGQLDRLYDGLQKDPRGFDWVISTGNFGVWPDPLRASRAARRSPNGPGNFIDYLVGKKTIPIPTILVPGKHEDHLWIQRMVKQGDGELVFNLHYLVTGNKTNLENTDESYRVLSLGGTYSPKPWTLEGNYTMDQVRTACAAGPVDILITHEAPEGETFGDIKSQAKGLNKICFATRPRLLVHGKYSETVVYRTKQTNTLAICIGEGEYFPLEITEKDMNLHVMSPLG